MCKVTLIMAVYNGGQFLDEAIQSIFSQSYTDWKLLIVDDASTDGTKQVLQRYHNEPNVQVIYNETNVGLAASLNRGIKDCSSEYIARVDADDFQLPFRLKNQVQFLDLNSDVDLLGCNVNLLATDGQVTLGPFMSLSDAQIKKQLLKRNCIAHPTVMVRRRFFDKAGFYDESYRRAQDWELWLRGSNSKCVFASSSEVVAVYRTNDYRRNMKTAIRYSSSRFRIFYHYQKVSELIRALADVGVVILKAIRGMLP